MREVVISIACFHFLVIKADHGEEETSQNKRELGSAEDSHSGCAQKRCKYSAVLVDINKRPSSLCQPWENCARNANQVRFAPPQSSRHSKLEKADILEMTVKHLRNLQRAQMTGKFNIPL